MTENENRAEKDDGTGAHLDVPGVHLNVPDHDDPSDEETEEMGLRSRSRHW